MHVSKAVLPYMFLVLYHASEWVFFFLSFGFKHTKNIYIICIFMIYLLSLLFFDFPFRSSLLLILAVTRLENGIRGARKARRKTWIETSISVTCRMLSQLLSWTGTSKIKRILQNVCVCCVVSIRCRFYFWFCTFSSQLELPLWAALVKHFQC